MVDHVKLEIAVQIAAENIGDIYRKIELNTDPSMQPIYEKELEIAFDEKERVARGEIQIIEKLLSERRNRNGRK